MVSLAAEEKCFLPLHNVSRKCFQPEKTNAMPHVTLVGFKIVKHS